MAKAKKTIKKAVKSAVKKATHTAKKVAEKAPPAPKPEVPKESKIRKHLEGLRMQRRDAAQIWDEINNKDHTDEDLRELMRQHNFGTLLGEVS